MADDEKGKYRTPIEQYASVEIPAVNMGPAATPMMGPVGSSPAVPAATPANFVCLRGPCRFYWELKTFMASGNPASTWDPEIGLKDQDGKPLQMPKQVNRTCLAHPGTETELTEDAVYECSRWEPMTARELRRRDKVRKQYFKRNPDHDPTFVSASRLRR